MSSEQFINKRARHEYEILDRWEAGITLKGSEVKSIREGRVSFTDSFAHIKGGEAYLHDLHIAPYSATGYSTGGPKRERKLLLHKKQILSLMGTLTQKNSFLTLSAPLGNIRQLVPVDGSALGGTL